MSGLLAGKSIIITGASRGIGDASARLFAREGARLTLGGRDAASLAPLVEDIKQAGGEAMAVAVDVSRGNEVEAMVAAAVRAYGRLDGAFNNAGVDGVLAPAADYPEDEFDRVIAINLKGVYNCMRFQIPAMLQSGGGAIVNNSSAIGEVGQYNMVGYCASKAGVIGATKAAALDYAHRGIRINALAPGVTETPMMTTQMKNVPGLRDILTSREPIGRLATPQEMAEAACWMLSDRASYLVGTNLAFDGGYLAI